MTHQEEYDKIINFRKANPLPEDQYGENHHIVPKSICPLLKDSPDNIVKLTAQEHFLAHYHLWLAYRDELKDKSCAKKMCFALYRMKQQLMKCDDIETMAKLYEEAKQNVDFATNRGKKFTDEHKRRIGESHKGQKNWNTHHRGKDSPSYGMKRSDEQKLKNRLAHLGKTVSVETRKKLSQRNSGKNNPMYGKNSWEGFTKEQAFLRKAKMSQALTGRKWFNNGVNEIFTYEPPAGYNKGRLIRKKNV